MQNDLGRVAAQPGSHPSGHAGCAVDGAPRFDPSRVMAEMRHYHEAAMNEGFVPFRWHISEPLLRELSVGGARPARIFSLSVVDHEEWAWGWMLGTRRAGRFGDGEVFFEPRDSDTRRMAETGTGSVRSTGSAVAQPIAQPGGDTNHA